PSPHRLHRRGMPVRGGRHVDRPQRDLEPDGGGVPRRQAQLPLRLPRSGACRLRARRSRGAPGMHALRPGHHRDRRSVPQGRGAGDLGVMALQAASGMFAFNALLLAGLALTSAAEGGIVTSTTPAVAAALAAVVLGERWTGRRSAAIGLAVLGILIVTSLGAATPARGPQPALGNALVFGAVVAEAIFLVCSRVLARRLRPVTVAAGITLLGFLMFAPLALRDARAVDLTQLGVGDWCALVYYGVAVTWWPSCCGPAAFAKSKRPRRPSSRVCCR